MTPKLEEEARQHIEAVLVSAGWILQDRSQVNLAAGPGVAVRFLRGDGEDDGSIVGFDDDLEIVGVTAQVLGWHLPEGGA